MIDPLCKKEDKISKLPDCVLHHILSFLFTREVVPTCILSKRWNHLWTSIPTINIDDSSLYSTEEDSSCFVNFCEKVLLLHDRDSSNLVSFRLSCRVCFNATRVHSWVSTAINRNIEELDLCLFVDEHFTLPNSVFVTKSLKLLKIEMNCILQIPSFVSFKSLKTLHLCLVTFPDDDSTQRLFSGCPVLKELILLDCEWMYLKKISICIASLKRLVIDDLPIFGYDDDDIRGCEIKIDAENLELFKYSGSLSNEISFCNLESLDCAFIRISDLCKRVKLASKRAFKLFHRLINVCFLQISSNTIELIFPHDNVEHQALVFKNMTRLDLSMEIEDYTILPLMEFLKCLPKLESLNFHKGLNPVMNMNGDDWFCKPVPVGFLSSLKNVTLQICHGNELEMQFLNTLLKHALSLKLMKLYSSDNLLKDLKKRKEFKNQLQMLPGCSRGCEIMLF